MASFRQGDKRNLALVGLRKTGKTSILLEFKRKLTDADVLPVFVYIKPEEITTFAHRFMGAFLYEFLKRRGEKPDLADIENEPLGELPDTNWRNKRNKILLLLGKACGIKGMGLAAATKVLHLKRPKLVPILDSYIVNILLDRNMPQNKAKLPPLGIEAMNIIREDIIANREEFQKLSRRLVDLPIPLETVRVYDILAWTHEKWDRMGITSTPYGSSNS